METDQNVVMIVAQVLIAQPVVRTVIAIRVHHHAQVQIVPIVRHVRMVTARNVAMIVVHRVIVQPVVLMVIDQNVVMIVVQVPIDQQVVHTETATHAQVLIVQPVAPTVIVTHVRHRAHLPIAANAVTVHATHAQVLIVHVAKTHTVAIARAQAMIAMPVRLRVTANAVADQIVPEVASPMIAKNVHAVALAKSA
jgi:hypothetical protein